MNSDQASQFYNGIIPDDIRKTFIHGSYDNYYAAFLLTAERNFMRRFRDILRSICVWRQYADYPEHIRNIMLQSLSCGLSQARAAAIESWGLLQERSSASAVIALPINTV